MKYRFAGHEAEIAGVARMDRFGQVVELPAGMEAEAAAALLVPEEKFLGFGFTEDELARYQMPGSHAGAAPEFVEKKAQLAKWLSGGTVEVTSEHGQ